MARLRGDRDAQVRRSQEWARRPGLSRALRVFVYAGPAAASFAVALLLARVLPRAVDLPTHVLWLLVIATSALLTLLAVERATRRLLPLAALLNLSLTFPDRAPARFAVARRTGRPRDLQAGLLRAQRDGAEDDAHRMQTVVELVLALSVHDRASRGHSERVRVFTDLLAEELKVPQAARNRLRWAALLHDIGKLEVPTGILTKPGAPTEEEWAVLHRHPEDGARLVAALLPWLGEWGLAVEQHHERFDGTGYPHRLRGHEISLAARIVAVADTYEVMTAPRPYKRPMSVVAAREELVRVAGSQLDPAVVRAFLNVSVGRLWRTIGFGAWIGQIPTVARMLSIGSSAGSGITAGIASAATATVIAASGIVAPAPPATPAPGPGSATAVIPAATAGGDRVAPTPSPRAAPSSPRSPTSQASTARPGPTPAGATSSPTGTPRPTPVTSPSPTPNPSPTPTATPAPTPDPWSCANCTNTSPSCTSYCSGGNLGSCITYCSGGHNSACTSHCFGGNNPVCLDYCVGGHNPSCQVDCRSGLMLPFALPLLRRRRGSGARRRRCWPRRSAPPARW